jgi:hypothetical protein
MHALLLLCAIQSTAPAPGDTPLPGSVFEMHGTLSLRYRARWNGQGSDQDFAELLELDVGNAAHDALTGSLSAEARQDIDGVTRPGNSNAFFELEDTRGNAYDEHLYHAYVDVHAASGWETLRAGRQTIVDTPLTAWFDGLRAETREAGPARARFGAYGGVPVKLYSDSTAGDALYGAFAEARPWSGARVRGDWLHAEDDQRLGTLSNDLFGIGLWQSLGNSLRLDGQYTRLEDEDRDVRLRASWSASDSDLVLRASWYRLLEPQGELAQPLDPFYATLHTLEPYQQFGLQLSKSLSSHLHLEAGYDARRVDEAQNVGAFNHDYDRGYATLSLQGLLPGALDLSLTGDVWDSQQSDMRTLGAELARTFAERLDAALGTYYSLYEYDLFQARELDHVRVWYLKLVLDRSAPLRFDLRYEFEDDPIDQFQALRMGATWRF